MEGGERGRTTQRAERDGKPKPRTTQAERPRSGGEVAKAAEPPPPGRSRSERSARRFRAALGGRTT